MFSVVQSARAELALLDLRSATDSFLAATSPADVPTLDLDSPAVDLALLTLQRDLSVAKSRLRLLTESPIHIGS